MGVVIADALRQSFSVWGILKNVFTITVDNVSVNASAIDILKNDFELSGSLPIGGLLLYVRCSYYKFVGASRACRNKGDNRYR